MYGSKGHYLNSRSPELAELVKAMNTGTQYSNSLNVSHRRCHFLPFFSLDDLLPPPPRPPPPPPPPIELLLLAPFQLAWWASPSVSLTSLCCTSSSEPSPRGDSMISKVVGEEKCFTRYVLRSKGRRFRGFPGA